MRGVTAGDGPGGDPGLVLDLRAIADLARAVAARPLTLRRGAAIGAYATLFTAFRTAIELGRRADRILSPGFKTRRVVQPFFICANMRSGTTLLHYLLSLDRERFTHYELWQTLLPALTYYHAADLLKAADKKLGGPLSGLLNHLNHHYFGGWDGIHNTGLDRPEEDEALFLFTGMSPGMLLLFHEVPEVRRNWCLDEQDEETRRRVMGFYESCIRRHLHAVGRGRTFLTKNTFWGPRFHSLFERFPDARVVYLVRHPYEVVPSCLNLFYVCWKAHSPEVAMRSPQTRALAEWAVAVYRAALDFRKQAPPGQFMTLRYEDLICDPVTAVEQVYEHYGMTMSARYRDRLAEVARCNHAERFKSARRLTLDDWGIPKEIIYEPLRDLFEEMGYEP